MFAPSAMPPSCPSALRSGERRGSAPFRRAFPRLLAGGLIAVGLLASAPAFAQGGRSDKVYLKDSSRHETGIITENSLTSIVLSRAGKEKPIDASKVERIVWGQFGSAYRDGLDYFERGDYENAAAKFILAATEDEREVIQAEARLLAGTALLRFGASDPASYVKSVEEFDRFLADYPDARGVPLARARQARATWLRGGDGDAAAAGALYRSLFEAGTGATPSEGYDRVASFEAGLQAIRALTGSGDTLGAREIAGVLSSAVGTVQGEAEEGSVEARRLASLAAEVQLAEGFALLAGDQAAQAETFFASQLASSAEGPAARRYGAMLGLGRAQLAQGKARDASVQLATVASIDYTDRDRSAEALLHLAKALLELGDSDGPAQARLRLEVLTDSFGDTPSATPARQLLASL